MKILKLLALWGFAISLCVTICHYGNTKYCRYETNGGWGFNKDGYYGETLEKKGKDGEEYKYVGTTLLFDKQPELRSILIIIILGLMVFFTFRIIEKAKKKKSTSSFSLPLTKNEIIETSSSATSSKQPPHNKHRSVIIT